MAGVWVTAGAPLETGDGWRVWYSWPQGPAPAGSPVVRTTGGQAMPVTLGPWESKPVQGSKRQIGVRELRISGATTGELYEVGFPERTRPRSSRRSAFWQAYLWTRGTRNPLE